MDFYIIIPRGYLVYRVNQRMKRTQGKMAYKKGNGRADDDTDDTALEQKRLQRCAWFCADPAVSYGENNDRIAGRHGQNQQDENKTCS